MKKLVVTLLVGWMIVGFGPVTVVFSANPVVPVPPTSTVPPMVENTPLLIPFGSELVPELPAIGAVPNASGELITGRADVGFRLMVGRVLNWAKIVLGGIAIFYVVSAGIALVQVGSSISEQISKSQQAVMYLAIGLVLVTISEQAVDFFFPLSSEADREFFVDFPEQAGPRLAGYARDLINYFLSFVGAGAILMLVISAIRLVINPGDDTEIGKQKKVVGYTALGIVMIAMSETLIDIVYRNAGYAGIDVERGVEEIVGLSNYVLGFMGIIILVTGIISGFYLLVYYGDEEKVSTVKKMMGNVVLGAIVAYSAYTVVSTIVNVLN